MGKTTEIGKGRSREITHDEALGIAQKSGEDATRAHIAAGREHLDSMEEFLPGVTSGEGERPATDSRRLSTGRPNKPQDPSRAKPRVEE
jgi:hypothetical protein